MKNEKGSFGNPPRGPYYCRRSLIIRVPVGRYVHSLLFVLAHSTVLLYYCNEIVVVCSTVKVSTFYSNQYFTSLYTRICSMVQLLLLYCVALLYRERQSDIDSGSTHPFLEKKKKKESQTFHFPTTSNAIHLIYSIPFISFIHSFIFSKACIHPNCIEMASLFEKKILLSIGFMGFWFCCMTLYFVTRISSQEHHYNSHSSNSISSSRLRGGGGPLETLLQRDTHDATAQSNKRLIVHRHQRHKYR
jgi:hypothetical protein